MDATGRVTDWNLAATNIFGWSRDSAVGELLERLIIPPEEVQRHRDGLAHYRETGAGPILGQVVELPALHQDGHRLVVDLTVWSVDATQSQDVHAFVRDITDRKLAEEELGQANADLSAFAALVAHDLRTPLTAINGFAEMMVTASTTGGNDPLLPELAQRIQASSERASALIDDILAFATVGRATRENLPTDLNPLVRLAWDEQMSINGRPATIDVQELPTVNGDAPLLGQLFANLLGNALKYVPADRVAHVVVDATSDPAGSDPVIRVTDNGKAIKVEDRDRVFSMFQRGHETHNEAGSGVGLAICRRVVERHHGRIWIETAPGGGTRFCVRLGSADRVGTAVDDLLRRGHATVSNNDA